MIKYLLDNAELLRPGQKLTAAELFSIEALIDWRATTDKVPVMHVEMIVTARFDVSHISQIEADDYYDVVQFIVDWKRTVN